MAATNYKTLISADSHIFEDHDLWTKALGDKYGDEIPHRIPEFNGEKGNFFYTGRQVVRLGKADDEYKTQDKLRRAGYEPEMRIKFQEDASVNAEVLYPTLALVLMQSQHFNGLKATAEVYNDWINEFCSHDPKRLYGVPMVPPVDVPWAVKEIDRLLKAGFRTIMINVRAPQGCPPYHSPIYDPIWARCEEAGVPITLHSLTGWIPDAFHPQTPEEVPETPRWIIESFMEVQATLGGDIILSGVFDRFPKLKIIISEFEIAWLRHFMWRLDMLHDTLSRRLPIKKLKRKPTDYIRQNTWYGWIDDDQGMEMAKFIGTDRVLWGSDFPHVRSLNVNAQSEVGKMLAGLPMEDQEKIVATNAAKLYNIN